MASTVHSDRPALDWGAAIAIALVAHGALYWWANSTETSGVAVGAGVLGVEIGLGGAGSAPPSVVAEIQPQEIEAEDVQTETATEVEAVEVQQAVEVTEVVEAVPDEVELVDMPEVVETKVVEAVKPVETPVKPPEPPVEKPVEIQEQKAEDVQIAEKAQPAKGPAVAEVEPTEQNDTAPADIGGTGKVGTTEKAGSGSGDGTAGGGTPGEKYDYGATVQAVLERNKEYPRRARRRGVEGVVQLWFQVDRQGYVLDYNIRESSGSRLLDRAVERLIEKVSPLPPFPKDWDRQTIDLVIPIRYFLD